MDRASLYDNASPESLAGIGYRAVLGRRVPARSPLLAAGPDGQRRRLERHQPDARDADLGPIAVRRAVRTRRPDAPCAPGRRTTATARTSPRSSCSRWPGTTPRHPRDRGRLRHLPGDPPDQRLPVRQRLSRAGDTDRSWRAARSTRCSSPDRTTWIYWQPILQPSVGNDLRTYSAYAVGHAGGSRRTLTVKAGVRLDVNDDRDSVGARRSSTRRGARGSARRGIRPGPRRVAGERRVVALRVRRSTPPSPTPRRPAAARRPTSTTTSGRR